MKAPEERQIHVRLPVELYKALRIRCVNEDKSIQEFVEGLLARELEDRARGSRNRNRPETARGR